MSKYLYSCAACGSNVKKEPLVNQKDWTKMADSKSKANGLGGWRCVGGCLGKIKVKRQIAKEQE